jgi:hypothetical protein
VLFAAGNFWGRTMSAISTSTDASSHGGFGACSLLQVWQLLAKITRCTQRILLLAPHLFRLLVTVSLSSCPQGTARLTKVFQVKAAHIEIESDSVWACMCKHTPLRLRVC